MVGHFSSFTCTWEVGPVPSDSYPSEVLAGLHQNSLCSVAHLLYLLTLTLSVLYAGLLLAHPCYVSILRTMPGTQ